MDISHTSAVDKAINYPVVTLYAIAINTMGDRPRQMITVTIILAIATDHQSIRLRLGSTPALILP